MPALGGLTPLIVYGICLAAGTALISILCTLLIEDGHCPAISKGARVTTASSCWGHIDRFGQQYLQWLLVMFFLGSAILVWAILIGWVQSLFKALRRKNIKVKLVKSIITGNCIVHKSRFMLQTQKALPSDRR
ncbi:MAG: hypothetical protein HRT36_03340 [Alphaproteobacteria bacterium]|nr:hypothetical protein [Alphaproteobacteria bacterium]